MIPIDEAYVDGSAPNANAIKNGRGLIAKGKLFDLAKDADDTIIFGKCKGSGKSDYATSIDFVKPDSPVYRCSCPSRQFPCKHALGIMYAYAMNQTFSVGEIPEDVLQKRDKAEARAEKKKENASKPKKVNKSALRKKIKAQLEGLDLLETMVNDLLRNGLANINSKSAREIEDHAKQLGNAYLPGAQNALRDLTSLFYNDAKFKDTDLDESARETVYSDALDLLTRLRAIWRRGRDYLNARLEDEELKPDASSNIAEWLGHVWQLTELKELGMVEQNVELIQLYFNSFDDAVRKQAVELGAWVNMGSGKIQLTKNIRPHRAAKYIKEDDCVFTPVKVEELCIYPGDMNPRVRWESKLPREMEPADYSKIRALAATALTPVIKEVRNQLKDPLADKTPYVLMSFKTIGMVGDEVVLEDAQGDRIGLIDAKYLDEPPCLHLLELLDSSVLQNQVVLLRFHHDLDQQQLRAKPLTFITESEVIRLVY